MPYIGNSPGTGTRNRYIYTATASQTTFSGADDNGKTLAYSDGDYVDVFLNGICLVPVDDYTATSKTSIVLTVGAAVDDILEVVAYDIATIADTVSKANGGNFEAGINVDGNVGIGTTSPAEELDVSADAPSIQLSSTNVNGRDYGFQSTNTGNFALYDGTAGANRMIIDEDGRKVFGHNSPVVLGSDNSYFQILGSGSNDSNITVARFQNSNYGPYVNIVKSRSATKGSFSSVSSGDYLGGINWYADDGTDANTPAASIEVQVDGTPGSNDMPGRLMFRTTADGASTTSERMRIDSAGTVHRYVGAQKVQRYVQLGLSNGTASGTLVSDLSTNLLTGTYTFAKVYMHGNENAATNASAREYILLKRTGGFSLSQQGSGVTYGNNNGNFSLSISGNSLVATRLGTGGTGTCFVVFDIFYR